MEHACSLHTKRQTVVPVLGEFKMLCLKYYFIKQINKRKHISVPLLKSNFIYQISYKKRKKKKSPEPPTKEIGERIQNTKKIATFTRLCRHNIKGTRGNKQSCLLTSRACRKIRMKHRMTLT